MDVVELIFKLIFNLIVALLLDVLFAQFAVWGLSYMHVHTGLIGPWLILGAISGVVTANSPSSKK